MKKIFTLSAAFVAAMSLSFTAAVAENVYGFAGSGTEADPYQLTSAADFATLAEKITADNTGQSEFFKVANDIDFAGVTYQPIAYTGANTAAKATIKFAGVIDGNEKSISNLVFNNPSAICAGLVGTLAADGVIKNLTVDESCSFAGDQYIAAFVGMSLGTVDNCINKANVTSKGTSAAGVVGNVQAGASLTNCTNYGNIQASTYAAGVSGMAIGAATFDHLVNYGDIRVVGSQGATGKAGSAAQAGGVVGTAFGTVTNCTNNGKVINAGFDATLYPEAVNELTPDKDGKNVGGIAAWAQKDTEISDCVNNGQAEGFSAVGGILGIANSTGIVVKNCTNNGQLQATVDCLGGIVANAQKDDTKVINCTNNGVLLADGLENAGNIVGKSTIIVEDCHRASHLPVLPLDTDQVTTAIFQVEQNTAEGVAFDIAGRRAMSASGLQIVNGQVRFVR